MEVGPPPQRIEVERVKSQVWVESRASGIRRASTGERDQEDRHAETCPNGGHGVGGRGAVAPVASRGREGSGPDPAKASGGGRAGLGALCWEPGLEAGTRDAYSGVFHARLLGPRPESHRKPGSHPGKSDPRDSLRQSSHSWGPCLASIANSWLSSF